MVAVINLSPKHVSYFKKAQEAYNSNNLDLADRLCKESTDIKQDFASAWGLWAEVQKSKGFYSQASEYLEKARAYNSTSSIQYNILKFATSDIKGAERWLDMVPDDQRDLIYYRNRADLCIQKIYLNLGDRSVNTNLAIQYLQEAFKFDNNFELFCLNVGGIYLLVKTFDKTIEYLEKAIKINKSNYISQSNLGMAYLGLKDFQKALESFRLALEYTPISDKYNAYLNLGSTLLSLDQLDEAEEYAIEAIRVNLLRREGAYKLLGKILLKQGNLHEAEDYLKKEYEITPHDLEIKDILEKLRREKKELNTHITLPSSLKPYCEKLAKEQASPYYNEFLSKTNEKIKTAQIVKRTLKDTFSKQEQCLVVDIGTGDGTLGISIVKTLLGEQKCNKVKYYGIDKDPDFAHATEERLLQAGIKDYSVIIGDCFGENLDLLPNNPSLLLVSHVAYYAPNTTDFTEKILRKMGVNTITLFIHESDYSIVTQLRDKFGNGINPKASRSIVATLLETEGIHFTELLFSSVVRIEPRHSNSEKLSGFIVQWPRECLNYVGLGYKYEEALKSITVNNYIFIWNNIQVVLRKEPLETNSFNKVTELDWAVFEGRVDLVNHLIENAEEINITTEIGISLLAMSLMLGHYNVARALISAGARILDSDREILGFSPIIYAAMDNNPAAKSILSDQGPITEEVVTVAIVEIPGEEVWKNVCNKDPSCEKVCSSASSTHQMIYIDEERDLIYLKHGKSYNLSLLLKERKFLSSLFFDMNATDDEGNTLLHIYSHPVFPIEKMHFFLKKGINTSIENNIRETPLHIACKHKDYSKVKILLDYSDSDIYSCKYHGPYSENTMATILSGECSRILSADA